MLVSAVLNKNASFPAAARTAFYKLEGEVHEELKQLETHARDVQVIFRQPRPKTVRVQVDSSVHESKEKSFNRFQGYTVSAIGS